MHNAYVEGSMVNIWQMIPINISNKPSIIDNGFIKANLSPKEIETYTALFKEYCDVFTWSYEEMPGINP